jgi:hypothetical protein
MSKETSIDIKKKNYPTPNSRAGLDNKTGRRDDNKEKRNKISLHLHILHTS